MEMRTDRSFNPIASKAYAPTMKILANSGLKEGTDFQAGDSTAGVDTDSVATVKFANANLGYVGARAVLSNGQLASWYANPSKYGGANGIIQKISEYSGKPVNQSTSTEAFKSLPLSKQNEVVKAIYKHEGGSGKLAPMTDGFDSRINKARELGYSDTAILDKISTSDPDMRARIVKARQLYGSGADGVTNDRDLLNFMSQKFVGKAPTVPSVADKNQPAGQQMQQQAQPAEGGAWFKSSPTDTPVEGALKAAGNTPQSAWNFAKGVVSSLNPLNTLNTISQIPEAVSGLVKDSGGILPALANFVKAVPGAAQETLVPKGINQLIAGDTAGAAKTFTEDPFGTVAPVVLGARGAAGALDTAAARLGRPTAVGAALDTGIAKLGQTVTKPAGAIAGTVGNAVGGVAGGLASKITSLDPQTISQVLSNPAEFSKMAQEQISRGSLANEVKGSIDSRIKNLSDTGKGYDVVRENPMPIATDAFNIQKVLEKNGLRVENGKVVADTNSITRNQQDLNSIQNFYDNWAHKTGDALAKGEKPQMSPSEFLNMREDLSDLSKFDRMSGKTKASEKIGQELRNTANKSLRPQIEGLEKLDTDYAPETTFLKQIKKDYLTKDGEFKDNAVTKIANAGNKSELLKRLEGVMPGVTKRLQILKAVEDIQHANGIKVGGYTRSLLEGASIMSGNLPGLIATIITHPNNAVQILRAAGIAGAKLAPIIEALNLIGGKINKSPEGLLQKLSQEKVLAAGESKIVGATPKATKIEHFEKGQGLSPEQVAQETKAFDKILQNEDQIIAHYMNREGGKLRNVVNTDDFRKYFTDEGYAGHNAATFQEPSSYLAKRAFEQLLQEGGDTVVFFGGGSGSGKTSAIKNIPGLSEQNAQAAAVLDGNLSSLSSAMKKIKQVESAGKGVRVQYVYRDPVESFVEGVVARMKNNPEEMGRLVPTKVVAGNHVDSWHVAKELADAGVRVDAIDNSLGRGAAKPVPIQELSQKINYPTVEELTNLLNEKAKELYEQGFIDNAQYEGYIK